MDSIRVLMNGCVYVSPIDENYEIRDVLAGENEIVMISFHRGELSRWSVGEGECIPAAKAGAFHLVVLEGIPSVWDVVLIGRGLERSTACIVRPWCADAIPEPIEE